MIALKRTILNVIGPRLLTAAQVFEVHEPSEKFRFIEIEAEAFKTAKVSPGDKVQINVGNWNLRTYTPISFNAEEGRIGILAYLHGGGPGSRWAESMKAGVPCQVMGPRPALKRPERPFVFFGDETAIATAASLERLLPRGLSAKFIFEASNPDETARIIRDLNLRKAEVLSKSNDAEETLRSILAAASGTEPVILAGRAQSIQQIRNRLREAGFPMARLTSKAYWSEGRVGLD